MVTKEQMVTVKSSESINCFFRHLLRSRQSITLWQNLGGATRVKQLVKLNRLHPQKGELHFLPRKDFFKFSTQVPIYFYAKKRTTIFKDSIYYNSSLQLILRMPESIMLKNIRQEIREPCEDMVSFMVGEDVNDRDFWFKAPMIDRSVGGFSFKTSINNVIKFKIGQKVQFKFKSMGSYASAVIVNVNKFTDGRSLKISVKNL